MMTPWPSDLVHAIDFLTKKNQLPEGSANFSFKWEGSLSDLKNK
jgi:hypothetical protein